LLYVMDPMTPGLKYINLNLS